MKKRQSEKAERLGQRLEKLGEITGQQVCTVSYKGNKNLRVKNKRFYKFEIRIFKSKASLVWSKARTVF